MNPSLAAQRAEETDHAQTVIGLDADNILNQASKLRAPRVTSDKRAEIPVTELADYILESAYWQGELSQARLQTYEALRVVTHEWDHLKGWEMMRQGKTEASITTAKRRVRPELYDAIQAAQWMIARLSEEIERLERDATKCSRVYTLYTGG